MGEKPYKCDQCLAVFTQKMNLQIHKQRHNGSFVLFKNCSKKF